MLLILCIAQHPLSRMAIARKKQLSADLKSQIILLKTQELTCKDIGSMFNVHESTVYRFCKQYDNSKSVVSKSRPGRPTKITQRDVRHLIRCIKQNRKTTLELLQKECQLEHVSLSTISRAIRFHTKFKNRFSKRKPFISIKNIRNRILWCRSHIAWTSDDWKHVVWSDESPFKIALPKKVSDMAVTKRSK